MKNKHLYWAFQSSQTLEPTEQELKVFQLKYKKDFEKRELYQGVELLEKYRLNGWRNPMFSQITGVIIGYENDGALRLKNIVGTEKDVLQTFSNLLKNHFQDYNLVHFDSEVVLPYIGIRLNKNNLKPTHQDLKYYNMRPWNLSAIDLKAYYQGAGKYSFSVDEIAYILNIDSEGIIPYDDEFTYFNSGDLKTLEISAIKKVEVISQIHRNLNDLPSLTTILTEEQVENVEEEKTVNILDNLYYSKKISEKDKEELKQIFAKKKFKTEEKEIAINIIKASLSEINQNFGSITNSKEVEEMIKGLGL